MVLGHASVLEGTEEEEASKRAEKQKGNIVNRGNGTVGWFMQTKFARALSDHAGGMYSTLSHVGGVGVKKVRVFPSRISFPGLGRAKSLVLV